MNQANVYELFINTDKVKKESFKAFYRAIAKNSGMLKTVRFHIALYDNHLRYFVESDKDLSFISSSTDFCTLSPANPDDIKVPENAKKQGVFMLPNGGGILGLQEKMSVKRGVKLVHFVCETKWLSEKYDHVNLYFYFLDSAGQYTVSKKLATNFPAHLFEVDFTTATNIIKSEYPKYLNIEKALSWLAPENNNAILEVDTFPFLPKPYYLNLTNYEFDKHSMIVGASGSGKSKFIELLVDRIYRLPNKDNYRVVVIDPHANLATDLQNSSASNNMKVLDFGKENAELFAGAQSDVTGATELTTTLMKSLMGDSWNSQVERVLRMSLFVLFTAKTMSLGMLKRFLIETELRQQVLDHVSDHVPNNIVHFFQTDYNEIRTAHYENGLMPIISIVDEMELQPTFLQEGGLSLKKSINENFMTVFSLNKVSMGEKVVKTVAGLLIQQIFLLAQAKSFNQKVLLFIDEVSVVQTPALASILSEARKYNLFVFLTQQYFTQVEKGLSDAIFANVSNYYCFRVSEEDATQLVGNLAMEIPKELAVESKEKGIKEEILKARFLTELNPRECVVRISAGGKILPSVKAKTVEVTYDPIRGASRSSTVEEASQPEVKKVPPAELKAFQETAPVQIDDFYQRAEEAIEVVSHKPPDFSTPTIEPGKEYSDKDLSELMKEAHPEAFSSGGKEVLPGEADDVLEGAPSPNSAPVEITGQGTTSPDIRLKNDTYPEAFNYGTKQVLSNKSTNDSQSAPQTLATDQVIQMVPTVIKYATDGTPIADRGMPDLNQLMQQESTKSNVE